MYSDLFLGAKIACYSLADIMNLIPSLYYFHLPQLCIFLYTPEWYSKSLLILLYYNDLKGTIR